MKKIYKEGKNEKEMRMKNMEEWERRAKVMLGKMRHKGRTKIIRKVEIKDNA